MTDPVSGRLSDAPPTATEMQPGSTIRAPDQACRVAFRLHADRTSFTGLSGARIVEPGRISVAVGGASDNLPLTGSIMFTGPVRIVGADRVLDTPVSVCGLSD